jgi:protein O-GlcNAc transferase
MRARIADAIALWRAGRRDDAERVCTAILAASRDQIDARGLLAEICCSRGQFGQAAEQLMRIAELRPTDAAAFRRLGDALYASAAYEAAADRFRHAIALDPNQPRAHNNLGRALMQLGQRQAAIESYRQAIVLDPSYSIAHNNLGIALGECRLPQEALACFERASTLNPKLTEAFCNQGNLLLKLRRVDLALTSYERALELDPRNAAVHCNCGNALLQLRRIGAALTFYDQALRLQPHFPEALNGRGSALRSQRRFEEAVACHDRAIMLRPNDVEALCNKASVLLEMERFEEVLGCCDQLLRLRADFTWALLQRGLALQLLKRHQEAIESLRHLMDVEPALDYAIGNLLFAGNLICDWSHAAVLADGMRSIAGGKPAISPFILLSLTDAAATQLQCARIFLADRHPTAPSALWTGRRCQNKKIRVAYLSGDLRNHALSYLMVGVFEEHDRDLFETFGIAFRKPTKEPFELRVVSAFDTFIDVRELSDLQVAELLYEMQIDIAVDLMGFTFGQRLNIFGHRPAPVQVSYLGFPGTTGAPYMDYIIADEFVIPQESRRHYSENVAYLPDCFQANDDRRVISDQRPIRAEVGLPESGFVFCCFNSSYKITPALFDIWCRLLKALPDSVLWIVSENDATQSNLSRAASMRRVDPRRLVFAGRAPYEQHLARLQLADLFLDTLPFNAGTTASDALWAGLPVLTCCGEAFASRMAGSLLHAIGLPELIAGSLEAYERLAFDLASAPEQLASLRARLARNRTRLPLFDTKRFCRHLESAYLTMYERFQSGQPAVGFSVAPQMTPHMGRSVSSGS